MRAFLSQGTPESITRLCALLLTLGFIGFAFAHPDQGGTLTVMGGVLLGVLGAKVAKDVMQKQEDVG